MNEPVNCVRCVFFCKGQSVNPESLLQSNFCAHPAYIESYGVPQHTGSSVRGESVEPVGGCILRESIRPEVLFEAVSEAVEFWAHIPTRAYSLEAFKKLREQDYRKERF